MAEADPRERPPVGLNSIAYAKSRFGILRDRAVLDSLHHAFNWDWLDPKVPYEWTVMREYDKQCCGDCNDIDASGCELPSEVMIVGEDN